MKLCWLIPNDRGGGVASVAVSCCRQATLAEHDVTLLMVRPSTGWFTEQSSFRHDSLEIVGDASDAPVRLLNWLEKNPVDVLFLNACIEADPVVPHLPTSVHCVYVLHDSARIYRESALKHERSLDAIVAVSENVARELAGKLEDSRRLRVIHNGTFFPVLENETGQARANNLVFLGSSNPHKGAFDVPAVWEALLNRQFGGELHWFGEITPKLLKKINRLPASDRIHLHGRKDRETVFAACAKSKVLLMLSRIEPFGMATIEAMGVGCLPVAWDVPEGTREIIVDGRNGFLCPLGHYRQYADTVVKALECHDQLYRDAMQYCRERFSEETMWQGYELLLRDMKQAGVADRPRAGLEPGKFMPPRRIFQLLPKSLRTAAMNLVARSPRLGYWLRGLRGR